MALLLVLAAAVTAFVIGLSAGGRRASGLQDKLGALETEMSKQQASQAQVIHTTKLASLGQMVAGVAHEINTPLGFVKSNLEVIGDLLSEYDQQMTRLLTGVDAMLYTDAATLAQAQAALAKAKAEIQANTAFADAKDLLTDSQDGIKTISNLVLNLKGFARVDRDGMDMTDLNDSVRSALTVASHQLRDRIRVEQHLGALPKVRCMPSQINQVFLNLITNAAQAMGESGTLTVTSRANGGNVEVAIADTGSGIPDDVLPKIFDPFFTTKSLGEGTGLGLAIVHKIIKSHGGAIHVKTGVGQGTTFTISLPIESRAQAGAAKAA